MSFSLSHKLNGTLFRALSIFLFTSVPLWAMEGMKDDEANMSTPTVQQNNPDIVEKNPDVMEKKRSRRRRKKGNHSANHQEQSELQRGNSQQQSVNKPEESLEEKIEKAKRLCIEESEESMINALNIFEEVFELSGLTNREALDGYLGILQRMTICEKDLGPFFVSFMTAMKDPDQYMKEKKLCARNHKMLEVMFAKQIIEDCVSFFDLLFKGLLIKRYDIVLSSFLETLVAHGQEGIVPNLLMKLALKDGHMSSSCFLKYIYAIKCLLPKKNYDKVIPLYQEILDIFNSEMSNKNNKSLICSGMNTQSSIARGTIDICNIARELGVMYFGYKKDKQKAKDYFSQALKIAYEMKNSLHIAKCSHELACIHISLCDYEASLNHIKTLIDQEELVLKKIGVKRSFIEKLYMGTLQKLKRKSELDKLLQDKQKAAFKKRLLLAQKIKEALTFQVNSERANQTKIEKNTLPRQITSSLNNENSTYFDSLSHVPDEETFTPKKEKVKTRGVARSDIEPESIESGEKGIQEIITIEDILGIHGGPYKTFCSLFIGIDDGKEDLKIPLAKVGKLLNRLGQDSEASKKEDSGEKEKEFDKKPKGSQGKKKKHPRKAFDRAQGKGSHAGGAMYSELLFGEGSDLKNEVMTFAGHTFLKRYQIKDLRKRFVQWNLYPVSLKPASLKKVLQQK